MSLGRKLVRGRFYGRSATVTPLATPLTITGLNRWYDPSDATTITHIDNIVSQMDDKSTNGYDMVQTTESRKPTYSTIGSLGALDFDGSADCMTNTDITYFSGQDKPWTVSVVASVDVVAVANLCGLNSNGNPWHVIQMRTGANGWRIDRRADNAGRVFLDATGAAATGKHLYTMVFTGTAVTFRIDGAVTSINSTAMDVDTATFLRFAIGAHVDASFSSFFNGQIGELVVYESALSGTDVDTIETYLADKWGVTLP